LTFNNNTFRKDVLNRCATTDALALLDSKGARMVSGVSPYLIAVGDVLPQMPVVGHFPAIANKETPAPAQSMEEIPIAKAVNTFDTEMDNMMKAFEAWTFQLRKENEPTYRGY
jgi:hypothetical protein